ncbi:MAG: prepilin peptidase [Alphaproteobacteria bacterium]|nr:prepilin peptidase [Alphaproteobacteria bacterium]MBV8548900.1 prepilin peptidase [Alphaproteobacteria bacterium]
MHLAILFSVAVLLAAAAYNDAQYYRIPNRICVALILLFPASLLTAPSDIDWHQHLMIFILVLVFGFIMFTQQIAGGGDIKLLAAISLWAGPHYIAVFIITTALAGGLLAVLMVGLTRLRNRKRAKPLAIQNVPIPYGVAIAAGGFIALYHLVQPILFPE